MLPLTRVGSSLCVIMASGVPKILNEDHVHPLMPILSRWSIIAAIEKL